jgi:hypothetical protein
MKTIILSGLALIVSGSLLPPDPVVDIRARQCDGPDACEGDTGTVLIVSGSSTYTVPTATAPIETPTSTEAIAAPSVFQTTRATAPSAVSTTGGSVATSTPFLPTTSGTILTCRPSIILASVVLAAVGATLL